MERLQKTVKISAKKTPTIQVLIGSQAMTEQQVIDNVKTLYDQIVHNLPKEENNVRRVYLKVTMEAPVQLN